MFVATGALFASVAFRFIAAFGTARPLDTYSALVTLHGTLMLFVVVPSVVFGLLAPASMVSLSGCRCEENGSR